MLIKNAKVFVGKKFLEGDILFHETITQIGRLEGPADLDAQGGYVIPGLVDIHTHGAVGADFSDGRSAGLSALAGYYASHGVTSILATTMTLQEPELIKAMHSLRDHTPKPDEAKIAGIHLEGPFLSYAKRGAQAAENLHKPDIALFHRLNEASGGQVRMITIACEEPGALPFIREASKICTVSLGHTTADYDTAMSGFAAGATHTTHLYNGMPALGHRAPGVIGAAFDSSASVELICDGLHIHPSVIRATYQLFGDKLSLISDSLRCAGMPDGNYELGGQPIVVQNGRATLPEGTLAGSSISLMEAMRNAVSFGIPLETAVYSATTAPALAAGLKAGTLQAGCAADLLVLDQALNLKAVFIDGKLSGHTKQFSYCSC